MNYLTFKTPQAKDLWIQQEGQIVLASLERNKKKLEELLRFEDLISNFSGNVLNVPPDRVEGEIGRALSEIRRFFKTDNCSLLEVLADRRQARFVFTTAKENRLGRGLSVNILHDHPWVLRHLVERGELVIFSSLDALPPEANMDRAAFEQEGIQALLALPLRVGGQVTHLISLESLRSGHEWPDADIRRLRVLGEVMAKALIHKRAMEALLDSEREMAEVQRIAHIGSWKWDIRGGTCHWSDEVYRIFGLIPQKDEATYEAFLASVHPDDREAVVRANQKAFSDPNRTYAIEYRVVRLDGTERVVHARADVVFDQDRRPVHAIGTLQDITARKQEEAEGSVNQMRLNMALEAAGMVTWEWDIPTGFIRYSDNIQTIIRGAEVKPYCSLDTLMPYIHREDRERLAQALVRSSKQGILFECEYRALMLDGAYYWILGKGKPLVTEGNIPVRVLGFSMDITERKLAQEKLEKALDEIKKLKGQLKAENIYLREKMEVGTEFKDVIGASDEIKYVIHRIRQVANASTTVLLTGETGTGKGVFARIIHEASNRKAKPFVHVNCAGLPPNLIESELFGREKGAFTGSTARQIGRFELANGGTIFLDEIGELPLELQSKLLKVIDHGEFERLGSPRGVKVDVRIVASTNRNLEEGIKRGEFRKDLFYRLNVFPITIPPLRQRREDIPLLVKFYVDKFNKKLGKNIESVPGNVMKVFKEYAWPGNVRELMNVVERAVVVSEGSELRSAHEIDGILLDCQEEGTKVERKKDSKSLSAVEEEHILRALNETAWRIEGSSGAANLIGMNPSTLRSRMRKFNIKRPKRG